MLFYFYSDMAADMLQTPKPFCARLCRQTKTADTATREKKRRDCRGSRWCNPENITLKEGLITWNIGLLPVSLSVCCLPIAFT